MLKLMGKKIFTVLHSNVLLILTYVFTNRVPTSSGNHGKPGKSLKKVPCMIKSWNWKTI